MPPGNPVDVIFSASVLVHNIKPASYQAQIEVSVDTPQTNKKPSGLMVDYSHPNPAPLVASVTSEVPKKSGAWGKAGTVAAKWSLTRCITSYPPLETSCDINGSVTIEVRQ